MQRRQPVLGDRPPELLERDAVGVQLVQQGANSPGLDVTSRAETFTARLQAAGPIDLRVNTPASCMPAP